MVGFGFDFYSGRPIRSPIERIVDFKFYKISQGVCKMARTPTLN
jgi:hypothetical protein